jgi:1-acyl-sn-glycerol-3-phosphate acyltransferase
MRSVVSLLLLVLVRLVAPAQIRRLDTRQSARPRVYFANHASHLDFLVVWAALPAAERRRTRPVAAADYWGRTRIRRYLAGAVGAVVVDRRGGGGREAVARMSAALGGGATLVLFPEGKRAGGSSPAAFRSGLYHVGLACPDVELVPVRIEHTDRVLPRGRLVPVPRRVRVTFGRPLSLGAAESKEPFLRRAQRAVETLAPAPVTAPRPNERESRRVAPSPGARSRE